MVDITLFLYDTAGCREMKLEESGKPAEELLKGSQICWMNIDCHKYEEAAEYLRETLKLHPLVIEDVINFKQRPKLEDYGEYCYIVVKMLYPGKRLSRIMGEQLSIIHGKGYVITVQKKGDDVFQPIREKLRTGSGRLRKEGADYLVYALLDAVVDHYFLVLDQAGERIDVEEEMLVKNPTKEYLNRIHSYKREMLFFHKAVWPLREILSAITRGDYELYSENTLVYMRDVYDHIIQIMDTVETYRDILSGMIDIYISGVSNRTNEVMKVLTILSTLFMPLTFIAGVYGMNFRHMPELEWRWGYPAVMSAMVLIAIAMLLYFRRKKWL